MSATPNPVRAGNHLIDTVTVANSGPATATAVDITDVLPSNTRFAYVEAAAPWSCTTPSTGSVGTVSCGALALAPGVTTTVRIAVTVVAGNKSNVVNTVQVASQSTDPEPAEQHGDLEHEGPGRKGVVRLNPRIKPSCYEANEPAKICQASADFATRLSTRYAFSPNA